MNKLRFTFNMIVAGFVLLTVTSLAQAQTTRTWIAGDGDDTQPCSRTAPCRTWSGAFSKTSTGGEINAIDASAASTLTISKAITIDGGGSYASTLAASTTGFIINAPGANVILRNLYINGAGSGVDGIRIVQANSVVVENCKIISFTGTGIKWAPTSSNGFLTVRNVTVENATVGGISIVNGLGFGRALIENSTFHRGGFGVKAGASAVVTVIDSVANGCTDGFLADGTNAQLNLERASASNNTTGVKVNGGAAIRISNCTISNNVSFGLDVVSGVIESYGTNMIRGNPNSDASTPVSES